MATFNTKYGVVDVQKISPYSTTCEIYHAETDEYFGTLETSSVSLLSSSLVEMVIDNYKKVWDGQTISSLFY